MRFAMFLLFCISVSALIIAWRTMPEVSRVPVRLALRRHWWVVVLVFIVLFSVAAALAPLNIRLF